VAGGLRRGVVIHIGHVDGEELTAEKVAERPSETHGILVPGGFGGRGTEGKIQAIRLARETGIPFFGICLGMQMAVVEYARHVCGLEGAQSTEFAPDSQHPVIDLMSDQRGVKQKGGTMRLGAYPCVLAEGSVVERIYGAREISERHRHRFEFNNDYRDVITKAGMVLSGLSPDERLVEMVELSDHPHFVGCQFHPEFKSRPHSPHPLFTSFVAAARERRDQRAARESRVELKEAGEPAKRAVH